MTVLLQGQEVAIRDSAPFTYAYLECQGSYQQIPAKINEFMRRILQAGADAARATSSACT